MKGFKVIGNILFWATLAAPMLSFALVCTVGEVEIFGIAGILRYSWLMWLFIPVGVLSFVVGHMLKKRGEKYKKNYIIVFICLPLLVIFGSYRFIFTQVSYDAVNIASIEKIVNVEIPDDIKSATEKTKSYTVTYLKVANKRSNSEFEKTVKENSLWQDKLSSNIKGILPINIQVELVNFDYFIFYNFTSEEYNTYPLEGKSVCLFVAYDYELKRLVILEDYTVTID